MWDFSRYNVIVQQVEGCSDLLHEAADRIESLVGLDPAGVAGKLHANLLLAVDELDRRALGMLSFYDPAAGGFIRAGVVRDPRRGEWRRKSPPAALPPASQKPTRGGRRKRLKAGR